MQLSSPRIKADKNRKCTKAVIQSVVSALGKTKQVWRRETRAHVCRARGWLQVSGRLATQRTSEEALQKGAWRGAGRDGGAWEASDQAVL